MPTLRDIRRRISGVSNTSKITQAMKMVSAAKLRRAQEAILSARPYVLKLEDMLSNLVAAIGEDYSHPLIEQRKEIKSIAVIVISSDRGLCGSFNSNLLRTVSLFINNDLAKDYPGAAVTLLTVGKKSISYFDKEKYPIIAKFPDVFAQLNFVQARQIVDMARSGFTSGKFDKVFIYYNEFVNVVRQQPKVLTLLPIQPKKEEKTGIHSSVDYIFEPEKVAILDELMPKLVNIQLWRTMLESAAAEQAARMMAMDNATLNAKEIIKHLELVFNKKRQELITKEMLEIVGGADALKK